MKFWKCWLKAFALFKDPASTVILMADGAALCTPTTVSTYARNRESSVNQAMPGNFSYVDEQGLVITCCSSPCYVVAATQLSIARLKKVKSQRQGKGGTSSPAGKSRSECSGNQYWVSTPGRLAGISVRIEDHA